MNYHFKLHNLRELGKILRAQRASVYDPQGRVTSCSSVFRFHTFSSLLLLLFCPYVRDTSILLCLYFASFETKY